MPVKRFRPVPPARREADEAPPRDTRQVRAVLSRMLGARADLLIPASTRQRQPRPARPYRIDPASIDVCRFMVLGDPSPGFDGAVLGGVEPVVGDAIDRAFVARTVHRGRSSGPPRSSRGQVAARRCRQRRCRRSPRTRAGCRPSTPRPCGLAASRDRRGARHGRRRSAGRSTAPCRGRDGRFSRSSAVIRSRSSVAGLNALIALRLAHPLRQRLDRAAERSRQGRSPTDPLCGRARRDDAASSSAHDPSEARRARGPDVGSDDTGRPHRPASTGCDSRTTEVTVQKPDRRLRAITGVDLSQYSPDVNLDGRF